MCKADQKHEFKTINSGMHTQQGIGLWMIFRVLFCFSDMLNNKNIIPLYRGNILSKIINILGVLNVLIPFLVKQASFAVCYFQHIDSKGNASCVNDP